jgi:hypothetical protein
MPMRREHKLVGWRSAPRAFVEADCSHTTRGCSRQRSARHTRASSPGTVESHRQGIPPHASEGTPVGPARKSCRQRTLCETTLHTAESSSAGSVDRCRGQRIGWLCGVASLPRVHSPHAQPDRHDGGFAPPGDRHAGRCVVHHRRVSSFGRRTVSEHRLASCARLPRTYSEPGRSEAWVDGGLTMVGGTMQSIANIPRRYHAASALSVRRQ